ncbi:hypothetical protein NLI96_g10392 [Meripilus lineatus]|uniref:NUDE domain-containing protein n=1 Tax=Meripilus lineatus TaxID=2056292 RepID=A0AAD5YC17_9APHY|nr:hypothetical protein NLI96_g10392 [Physisporinus lineatus]
MTTGIHIPMISAHPRHLVSLSSQRSPSSTDWEAKFRESDARRHELEALLEDTRLELDEFQLSSRELEEELEKDLERSEKAKTELENKVAKIEDDRDTWKSKFMSLQTTYNTTTASLQRELDTLRQDHQKVKVQLRELEMGNDDLERNERAISSSLADTEQKYARVLEEKILLEHELLDKATLEEETQRLKDELRDANEEVTILKERLANAQKAASVSDLPTSSATSVTSNTPSDEESLLSTPAPPGLNLADLASSEPPETPAKEFPPLIMKPPQATYPTHGQASLLQRAGFHPPKSGISTPPSGLARSSTLPSFSTPSRIPPRTPLSRPLTNRNVSNMSSTSTVSGTAAKSRGVQMVSEMRARVKVLEQKIHTRVPRLRMASVTNRINGNAPHTPKAGPSGISSPITSSTSSSSLRPNKSPERTSTLRPRRQSIDSDSENRRTPASDSSGWVLIMEDSPSPVKDKEKERRRTSSPIAPSAYRGLISAASTSASPSPSNGSRAPSAMSQPGAPTNRRPISRLSVSTEGRSSISTVATTSTTSSIPTPISRPSTPTFLPIPSGGLYQSANGVGSKRSTGPSSGAHSQPKRISYGSSHSNSSTSTVVPSHIPSPHPNITTRSTSKALPSALAQSRIGRPGGGIARKNGGDDHSSDSGSSGKLSRGRSGSTSIFFGRDRN